MSAQSIPFKHLLPIHIYQIRFQWLEPVQLPFFHQGVLTGFLRSLLGLSDKEKAQFTIHAPESGKTDYRAGDSYTFYLFTFGETNSLGARFFHAFDQLPNTDRLHKLKGLIRDNIKLVEVRDAISKQLLADPRAASRIDTQLLSQHADALQQTRRQIVTLQLLTPTRIKPSNDNKTTARGRYCDTGDITAELLFTRIFDACSALQSDLLPHLPRTSRTTTPVFQTVASDLFWADSFYQDQEGSAKETSGVLGTLSFQAYELSHSQWMTLLLGQYIGIGQSRRFGCGRYRLLTEDGLSMMPEMTRTQPLQQDVFDLNRLEHYWRHELEKLPEQEKTQPENSFERLLPQLNIIHSGEYQPAPLTPRLLAEDSRKERLLTLPGFPDKVLHKLISSWLSSSLDQLYSKRSYGYRKGYSRLGAKDRITALVREGYLYALDADIADFFPSVDCDRVLNRLACLYGDDPLWSLLTRFLHADINRDLLPAGYEHFEPRGLNLGTSLSPVLANLMLDHLDTVLDSNNYQLVRYADDFLVLCKTQKEAQAAQTLVANVLAAQGLKLNPEKTRIRGFNQGIEFLGYLFLKDICVPLSPTSTSVTKAPSVRRSTSQDTHEAKHTALFYQACDNKTVCVTGDPALISLRNKRLQVERADTCIADIPLSHLDTLLIFGTHQVTTQALTHAMENDVSVHYATGFGRYQGTAAKLTPHPTLYLQQASHFSTETHRLHFAIALTQARIKSQLEVLRQRNLATEPLQQLRREIRHADCPQQCLGLEGQASRHYWQQLQVHIHPDWGFNRRQKRPATDPVNSMLSYGYSLLYSHVDSLIRTTGLQPSLGGYHHGRGRHNALASDLMEPFRYLIERSVLTLINTGQIKPQQFYVSQGKCWLEQDARRMWTKYLIDQLQTPQYRADNGNKRAALDQIQQQNHNLVRWIKGESDSFIPWTPQ